MTVKSGKVSYVHKPIAHPGEHPAPPSPTLDSEAHPLHHLGEVEHDSFFPLFVVGCVHSWHSSIYSI